MADCIAYYRVSTDKQGISGLGIEAQQTAVGDWITRGGHSLLSSFTEVESGKRSDRPQLLAALKLCKRRKATLVVAKLDRLARNVHFLSGLMESRVEFVACDNPHANRLTLHILAAVAEDEARRISERTKAALAAYKARGGTLGGRRVGNAADTPEMRLRASQAGSQANRKAALEAYADETPIIQSMHASGASLGTIADRLNSEGYQTVSGSPWGKVQVHRVLRRSKRPTSGA